MDKFGLRKSVGVAVSLCLTVFVISAAIAQERPTSPRIKVDPEVFDFGYVPQNATVSHTYWLRNTGTERVEIKQLRPNCGCTQVPPTDSLIAVGDSLPVEMLFGSRNISGKVEKFTRIVSNAAGRVPVLTFQAKVLKPDESPGPLVATPSIVRMTTSNTTKVAIRNTGKTTVKASVVDLPPNFIQLDVNELSLAPDETKELTISLVPQEQPGEFSKSITLEAGDAVKTRITIPITNIQRE